MSLSIDAHNAVAATALQSRTVVASDTNDQSPSPGASPSSSAPISTAGPAYSIATTASAAASPMGVALTGVRNDLDGDGARLMALQVKQALAGHTGSITSQSSQTLLSLFRT